MLVHEFLERSAERSPDKIALVCRGRRLTFAEIDDHSNRLGNALVAKGLQRHERAAIFLEDSAESVISVFGILKSGGVFLIVNPQAKARKIEYILNDCQVKILVTDSRRFPVVSAVLDRCPTLETVLLLDTDKPNLPSGPTNSLDMSSYYPTLDGYPSTRPERRSIDVDLACLIYTSGSTGSPKGVMLTHLNMCTAADSIIEYLENSNKDIIINCLPLSFDYGLYQVLMAFRFGGTVVLEGQFLYPYQVIDLMVKERVTGLPIVPSMAAILLQLDLTKYDFSSLRYITNTAQALPSKHIKQLLQLFPQSAIYSMYGLTECKRVSYLPPQELPNRMTSVGKAMPNTEVFIVDENDERIFEPGVVGELVVRGANIMKGYWNLPEETSRKLRPAVNPSEKLLYTGDLFKMDEEGYLYFVARKDNLIKSAGELVSPKEVENVLHDIEGVAEAAVIGVPDELLGQAIKAFVVLEDSAGLDEKEIIRQCARHLENYLVPRFVEFRRELPKTSSGKTKDTTLAKGTS